MIHLSWFVGGLLLTVMFMIVQLPTRFVITLLPSMPAISLSESTGTVWLGGVCAKVQMIPEKVCMNWDWQLSPLLSGNMQWDVIAVTQDVQSKMLVSVNPAKWQVNGVLSTTAGQSIPQWAAWLPAGKTISEKKLDFSEPW